MAKPKEPDVPMGQPTSGRFGAKGRICGAMFLQHYSLGCWMVSLGTYISAHTASRAATHGATANAVGQGGFFEPGFAGAASGTAALGALVSPFVTGWLADRHFSVERLLAALHVLAAVALGLTVAARNQMEFFAGLIAFFAFYSPTYSLTNALAFRHLHDAQKEFPMVRAWGTAGWIVAGWTVGWFCTWLNGGHSVESTLLPLQIGVVAECVAAAYCLLLPHTPPLPRQPVESATPPGRPRLLSREKVNVLLHSPAIVVALGIGFLTALPSQFYYAYGNMFFNAHGMTGAAAKMTLGQLTEIGCMLALPFLLGRFGLKVVLIGGIVGWAVRYACLAEASTSTTFAGWSWSMAYLAILLHGVSYTFVSISLQVYVQRVAGTRFKATAQGLLVIATSGLGHLVGAAFAALSERALLRSPTWQGEPNWYAFWLLPCCGAAVAAALVLAFFAGCRSEASSGARSQREECSDAS